MEHTWYSTGDISSCNQNNGCPPQNTGGQTSSTQEERVARSVALEKAYVHDVYEQLDDEGTCSEPGGRGSSRPWPRVNHFLADLEPGSIVCDVGCGQGKYLNVNQTVFNIGADKCTRLTKLAKDKNTEVLICDNLSLPFRDESFDAVLSISVVHHFATTERRVCALRELARVLRIGGRLVISAWAMEQRGRRFESQDVLVPCHRSPGAPASTPSFEHTTSTNTSEDDIPAPYHAYTQTSDSDSNKSFRTKGGFRKKGRTKHKGRSIDPNRSSSPSSSSLSSPNETCYSFVRRAIQKLAGSKRSGTSHRPWFLETWNSCTKEPPQKRYDPDGCESYDYGNIQDLPIELRRVDDDDPPQRRQTFPSSQINTVYDLYGGIKSKSLTNIKTFEEKSLVRSQSSVPSLQDVKLEEGEETQSEDTTSKSSTRSLNKPKLVKQKQSICEEDAEEALDEPTDMKNLITNLPDFKVYHGQRGNMFKQRSMNEELMSTERLREKERVKQNIQKQASLNEELIYQRHALDSIRDSLFSVSTSKRFQLIKSGFTNTIKNSTTNIEKVAGSSLKNGFVRMFQGWKTTDLLVSPTQLEETPETPRVEIIKTIVNDEKKENITGGERRHSKEDGSDSSKDSSLQSDTSVDSEDSFASVIFVPKADPLSPAPLSPGPTSPRLTKQASVPNSPRMKQSSCPTSPRIKNMPLTVYPLTKQLSSPKPSTNTAINISYKPTSPNIENILNARDQHDESFNTTDIKCTIIEPCETPKESSPLQTNNPKSETLAEKYSVAKIPKFKKSDEIDAKKGEQMNEDKKRSERLKQIRELLNQRPGFGIRSSRSAFPIVRHASTNSSGKSEPIAKQMPRLLSLELFNPETDDKDSDSSGVSSPDSVDSVINIECSGDSNGGMKQLEKLSPQKTTSPTKFAFPPLIEEPKEYELETLDKPEETQQKLSPLLEAAANVASSLDEAVDKVIQSSPRAKRKQFLQPLEPKEVLSVMERSYNCDSISPNDDDTTQLIGSNWDEECHKHLTDFADKLSEKLLQEIDQYQESSRKLEKEVKFLSSSNYQHINDPYIHRLSEELEDLNKLSAEIQKQNEYLTKLSTFDGFRGCSSKSDNLKPKCTKCTKKQCKCSEKVIQKLESDEQIIKEEPNITLQPKNLRLSRESSDASDIHSDIKTSSSVATSLHFGHSIDSNDTFDMSERTTASCSDSQKDTNSISRYSDGGSTASLRSCSDMNHITTKKRLGDGRSSSEEAATQCRVRDEEQILAENFGSLNTSLSDDTSQDSLPSDNVGGAITYHKYYHVFREGELDQLIERYVENLHIISSYYDHASWCVVAEKVQVWTI